MIRRSVDAFTAALLLSVFVIGCSGPSRLAFDPSTGGVASGDTSASLPSADSLFRSCSGVELEKGGVGMQCIDAQRFYVARYDATVSAKTCRDVLHDAYGEIELQPGPALPFADSSLTFRFSRDTDERVSSKAFAACASHRDGGLGLYTAQGGFAFDSSFVKQALSVLAYEGAPDDRITTRRPDTIPLLGRRLDVHPSCKWMGAQNLSCYPNGQMNWATFSSLKRAEEAVAKQIEHSRKSSDEVLSDTTVACTFEEVDTECRRITYQGPTLTKLSTAISGASNVLVALYTTAEVRGRPVHAVCSFWRDQATPNGLAALCRESFEVPSADSLLTRTHD